MVGFELKESNTSFMTQFFQKQVTVLQVLFTKLNIMSN
jgi:hypothetical protein